MPLKIYEVIVFVQVGSFIPIGRIFFSKDSASVDWITFHATLAQQNRSWLTVGLERFCTARVSECFLDIVYFPSTRHELTVG
jgi:hypothetical protein